MRRDDNLLAKAHRRGMAIAYGYHMLKLVWEGTDGCQILRWTARRGPRWIFRFPKML
jgi:hypothetical protein